MRQRPAAKLGGVNQPLGPVGFDLRTFFHVAQLPDVIMLPTRLHAPAEEYVAGGLENPLAHHNALPHVFVPAPAHELLQRGAPGLLDLQDERVVVAGHEQDDAAARPHTAHADHLHGDVHDSEALQEQAPVIGQRSLVSLKGLAEIRLEAVSSRGMEHEWRLVNDAPMSVHLPYALGEELLRCSLTRLGDHLLAAFARFRVTRLGDEVINVDAGVEHIQSLHPCELAKALAVSLAEVQHGLPAVGLAQPDGSPRQVEAGPKTLNVPLPRAGNGFVKIHQIDDQTPLGGAEAAEVA